ncbi:MAG: hypothetical protein ABI380_10430 [Edaphobacter sp.]
MSKTKHLSLKFYGYWLLIAGGLILCAAGPGLAAPPAQKTMPAADAASTPHRTRLFLKDGSYQIVMSYRLVGNGNIVRYISAERGGAEEEVPVALVDFDATHRWEKQHEPTQAGNSDAGASPAIDPELLKEEADRASLTPEVAKDLRLPEQGSVLALDTFHGSPELVPLAQMDSDLNRSTGHNILRAAINPLSSPHQVAQLKGERSYVQVHVAAPVFYIRMGDDSTLTGGTPLTVDTHGASSAVKSDPNSGSADSRYVIVRADVRSGVRDIASFRIGLLGGVQPQEDVVETTSEVLPGGHWMKLTPHQPLDFGEYALMEVISPKVVNLSVWDFGVHPVAPENRDVIKPEAKRPLVLERRRPD